MRQKFYLLTTICLLALVTGALAQKPDSCNAGFSYSISQASGKVVTFVASDSGQTKAMISTWYFGDGSTQRGINVSHTYAAWGTYHVTHIVVDSATRCMDSTTQTIKLDTTVQDSACFPGGVSFVYTKDSSKALSYTFTPTPNSQSDRYYWSFGDGTTSTQRLPTHTFNTDSIMNVTTVSLTVVHGGFDSCSASTSQVLQLSGPVKDTAPACNLPSITTIIDSTYSNRPGFYQFYAYPQNTSYKYYWDFGDGSTSTLMNPGHQYDSLKSWVVTLHVVAPPSKPGLDSCKGYAQLILTNPNPGGPNQGDSSKCSIGAVSFTFTTDSTNHRIVHFLPSPDSSNLHYFWNFGDGSTSTVATPTHTYGQGPAQFSVSLAVTQSGPDSCQGNAANTIYLIADSVGNDSTRCSLQNATFAYSVDSNSLTVHFLPLPDSSSYHYYWNFGDGTTSTLATPVHTYPSHQGYSATLVITSSGPDSCQGNIVKLVNLAPDTTGNDSTGTVGCSVSNPSFTYYKDSTNKLAIHFTGQPVRGTDHYYWTFGDGTYGSGSSAITHTYAKAGAYAVTLVVVQSGQDSCQASVTNPVYVGGADSTTNNCSVTYTYNVDSATANTLFLQGHPVPDSVVSAQWTISKYQDSIPIAYLSGVDQIYTFPDSGTYSVTLHTVTASGCVAQTQNNIVIGNTGLTYLKADSVPTVKCFPNPATDRVNLNVTLLTAGNISITIFSAMGSQVGTLQQGGAAGVNQISIPVKNLPQGIYFMHIQTGNTFSQSRFQKQ